MKSPSTINGWAFSLVAAPVVFALQCPRRTRWVPDNTVSKSSSNFRLMPRSWNGWPNSFATTITGRPLFSALLTDPAPVLSNPRTELNINRCWKIFSSEFPMVPLTPAWPQMVRTPLKIQIFRKTIHVWQLMAMSLSLGLCLIDGETNSRRIRNASKPERPVPNFIICRFITAAGFPPPIDFVFRLEEVHLYLMPHDKNGQSIQTYKTLSHN